MIPLRLASEYLHQLDRSGDDERLARALTTMRLFMMLFRGETRYDVQACWERLGGRADGEGMVLREAEEWSTASGRDRHSVVDGIGLAADLLDVLGCWEGVEALRGRSLELALAWEAARHEARARGAIGWLFIRRGR